MGKGDCFNIFSVKKETVKSKGTRTFLQFTGPHADDLKRRTGGAQLYSI